MKLNFLTPEEAVSEIKSNQRVFIHSAAATPLALVNALTNRASTLKNVELISIHTEGNAPYLDDKYAESFTVNTFFVSANSRKAVHSGRASYIPIFLSEIPKLFMSGIMPLDVALVQLSPPDKHGYCSTGVSVDITNTAIEVAKKVIAQINPNMPRVHGNGNIHISSVDAFCSSNDPIFELKVASPTAEETKIGKFISELVEDGATLQTGIGAIPNAALLALRNHKNLGMHTEMFSDGVIDLFECGALNGSMKKRQVGKIVSGFCMGSRKLYDFIDDNPIVEMRDISYVNDTAVIRTNPKVTAINSAIEVDLFGQICAESIGTLQYSGVGGQVDFIRGAALSEGGKPIIALNSVTNKGVSKIVSILKPGASVTTSRAHVHYVVTEFGVAYLYGKNLKERSKALIAIAHPEHRERLDKEAFELFNSH